MDHVGVSRWRVATGRGPARALRAQGVSYAAALVSVALVSALIGRVLGSVSLASSSMLYLVAVLATATVFASVAAFLTFDYFFVPPVHEFAVSDPGEWSRFCSFS